MTDPKEREYVLGTHEDEVERLGLQHRIWRNEAIECWKRSGITIGSKVLDVGTGPGYATVDLAEIVGPTGRVAGVERSAHFLEVARERCAARGLAHVDLREIDLMTDPIGVTGMDAAWCRWVASFVSSPQKLVASVASALRIGGMAGFHEYGVYKSWSLAPKGKFLASVVAEVEASWRETGGDPDVALALPTLLHDAGMRVRHMRPILWILKPSDYGWRWPAVFLEVQIRRLGEMRHKDPSWAESVRKEFEEAERNPNSIIITPLVLEIVAERVS